MLRKPGPGWTWDSHTPKTLFPLDVRASEDLPVLCCSPSSGLQDSLMEVLVIAVLGRSEQ
ncbi:hypothetical protein I79_019850 [Cricetulus griseus]|uniref:Uncharacterized protein n=1 Tax=Cricetulus griseus TaxID=10029 RepID=G3I8H7_CRIGR|nr:hypothetical protein I79_019850 [Cricetulus griseus]